MLHFIVRGVRLLVVLSPDGERTSRSSVCFRLAEPITRGTQTRTNTNPNDTEANAAGRRGVRMAIFALLEAS
jgi:hypothetical protein